jgi:FkbM family methyltransferase
MPHHPVFDQFGRWEGPVAAGWQANWLGVQTDASYANWDAAAEPMIVRPPLPDIDSEEYPEWIDLLTAASQAGDRFAMVELGAGFGRWLANGACAYRTLRPDGRLVLVGVEAEPTHFRWISQHLAANGIDLAAAELIEAAVDGRRGRVIFDTGDPSGSWGQRIRGPVTWRTRYKRFSRKRRVRAVTFADAVRTIDGVIDLIDLDVQGAEAHILENATGDLERVRRVHIGTHTYIGTQLIGDRVEERLRVLFRKLDWECQTDYPANTTVRETWWGGRNVRFVDGVQSWTNPTLA